MVLRSEHKLQEAVKQIEVSTGVAVSWIAADLYHAIGRQAVAAASSDIDILVNNAGGPPSMPFAQLEANHWQAIALAALLTSLQFRSARL